MVIKHTFKQLDSSDAVKAYTEEKVTKLLPHLRKQMQAHFIYKKVNSHQFGVQVILSGHNKVFQASSKSKDSLQGGVDSCVHKLVRQLARKKDKLQHHKSEMLSKRGKLRLVATQMQTPDEFEQEDETWERENAA